MIMKKILFAVFITILAGCSAGQEKLKTYLDEPQAILKDPHYADYKEKADTLESSYLKKEITYAEYLEKKKELDENYDKEVQERTDKIILPGY